MTDLRTALTDLLVDEPEAGIDGVAVLAAVRRREARRRRTLLLGVAAATATAAVATALVVVGVTRDDPGQPEPANPDRTDRTDRAIDPVAPPRDFAADPVLGFEADAPLLREGDVVLGRPSDRLEGGFLTEDLQVLISRRHGDDSQYGLIDPASPTEVDWLPVYPGAEDVLPLCGFLVREEGDCVQGERNLWFYVWVRPDQSQIDYLRFDRVTREWTEAGLPPRTPAGSPVDARLVDNDRVVIDGRSGRQVARLDRDPFCDRRAGMVPRSPADTGVGLVRVEGEFVTLEYYCSSVVDPGGGGDHGLAVFDAEGELLVNLQAPATTYDLVDDRFFVYRGMLVDLTGGRVYRLLRKEPHDLGQGWESAYAWVISVQSGLVTWSESHLDAETAANGGPDSGDGTLHLTPLPGA